MSCCCSIFKPKRLLLLGGRNAFDLDMPYHSNAMPSWGCYGCCFDEGTAPGKAEAAVGGLGHALYAQLALLIGVE
jgi:hypothetical protein